MLSKIITDGSQREAFITCLLEEHCGRQASVFHRLGRDSNNFVYRVELRPIVDEHGQPGSIDPRKQCPGATTLPSSTNNVVARISHPEAVLNEEVRVENEVAAMCLMRTALAGYSERLVPEVFAWGRSSSESPGWILQEYKEGVPLDKAFLDMDRGSQEGIHRQIAQVFKLIQDYELPASAIGYGGLAFDDSGENIVIGPTTIPCGGPFATLDDMYVQMMRRQLDESDSSSLLQGWRGDGRLRDRLDRFLAEGIAPLVRRNSVARPTLIHGDFNTFNMLVDPASGRLTALLDFDLSHVASPAEEFFYSFRTLGSLLAGPFETGDELLLRKCLLEGFDETPLTYDGHGKVNWPIAQNTDMEFSRAGVRKPAEIMGCGELAALKWFLEDLSPPYFYMPRWLEYQTPEGVDKTLQSIQSNVEKYLERWGF
ncbi:hypothetical protein F5Y12DRAFT_739836 [Xylaria sp. FL1777]|nr:hypothetical protein F5Y12DRAFT_739836 [Xylaria sp. FL1777]